MHPGARHLPNNRRPLRTIALLRHRSHEKLEPFCARDQTTSGQYKTTAGSCHPSLNPRRTLARARLRCPGPFYARLAAPLPSGHRPRVSPQPAPYAPRLPIRRRVAIEHPGHAAAHLLAVCFHGSACNDVDGAPVAILPASATCASFATQGCANDCCERLPNAWRRSGASIAARRTRICVLLTTTVSVSPSLMLTTRPVNGVCQEWRDR
jgi:hypothetical protein